MDYSLADFAISPVALSTLISLWLLLMIISAGIGMIFYYLRAVGIYEMSKTAGLKNPWYSFIPFLNVFALGRLAGMYDKKNGRKSENLGKTLMVLYIIFLIFALVYAFSAISVAVKMIFEIDASMAAGTEFNPEILKDFIPMLGSAVLFFIAAAVYQVIYYVCLWRIYSSFSEGSEVLYLVFSILLSGFLECIFLFLIRKNPARFSAAERNRGMYDITEKY